MPESNGIVQSNPMNNTHGKHTHNYSSFPDSLSYKNHLTLRFGEYTPTFVMDGEPKDEISLNTRHLIDSLSLNAPFKGSIRKITESFMVPKMALLPRTWDLIYVQPSNGDDVPKDANCVIQNFPERVTKTWMHLYSLFYAAAVPGATDVIPLLNGLIRMLVYGEYFFSAGSLLAVCGYHANNFIEIFADGKFRSYDAWFDLIIRKVFSYVKSFKVNESVGSSTIEHRFLGLGEGAESTPFDASFRSFLELVRENPSVFISSVQLTVSDGDFNTAIQNMLYEFDTDDYVFPDPDTPLEALISFLIRLPRPVAEGADDLTDMSQLNCDFSRLLAYQLVCAHYYSNSAVDFIYTADLYRNYIFNLIDRVYDSAHYVRYFEYNGVRVPYDYLSGHYLEQLLVDLLDVAGLEFSELAGNTPFVLYSLTACSAILAFRKSLRFGDYFVGSRPRPLAPVNTDVSVNNDMVSVIDVTRSIQAQRFANSVMRSRSKVENYVRDLFGKSPAPDYHNPFYLTRQAEIIFGDEVQNTAENQVTEANSRTANFKTGDNRFTFTFHNDDAHPCVYLQIVSFDIKRAYTRSIDRHFMHLDRFDMFNPDFQYIGDQPVYGYELGYTENDGVTIPSVFGYQGRDMEYKQRFDVASGGFVENLPGWILTDRDRSVFSVGHLDPDFIRSYNTELDQFFLSLNGFSLASYFHFICIAHNHVSAKRAMAVDPQILD